MKQVSPYLDAVLSGIEAIESYRPATQSLLAQDPKSYDAILMRLQDIGESLARVRDGFPEFWLVHSTDDWVQAIGLRNVISHGYRDIDVAIIWELISESFPAFKHSIEKAL